METSHWQTCSRLRRIVLRRFGHLLLCRSHRCGGRRRTCNSTTSTLFNITSFFRKSRIKPLSILPLLRRRYCRSPPPRWILLPRLGAPDNRYPIAAHDPPRRSRTRLLSQSSRFLLSIRQPRHCSTCGNVVANAFEYIICEASLWLVGGVRGIYLCLDICRCESGTLTLYWVNKTAEHFWNDGSDRQARKERCPRTKGGHGFFVSPSFD